MVRKLALMVGMVGLLICVSKAGWADLSFGSSAREMAMGGAGLALTDNPTASIARNPAALAYRSGFNFRWPNLAFRERGAAGLGDIIDKISQTGGDISTEDALDLVRDFATNETTMQLNLQTGLTVANLDFASAGEGQIRVIPNELLREWASSPLPTPDPPDGAGATINAGAIYSLPSIAMARKVESLGGKNASFAVGARVNLLHSVAYNSTVEWQAGVGDVTPEETLKETDWSADLGLIYELKKPIGAKVALVASDIKKPSLAGLNTETVFDAGFAMRTPIGLVVAADARNLTKAYGENMILCAGAEWKLGPLALRAGLSSKDSGLSIGVGLGSLLSLSFSPNSAFDAAATIHMLLP